MSSVSKIQLQKLLAQRVLARRRLLNFTQLTHPSYQAGWVHDDICRRLEKFSRDIVERKSPRLMLLMPPRHGKSELASIRFPAWHLGHNPTHEVINVGYNLDLPMTFSRKVREVMRDPHYSNIFPESNLSPDSQSAEAWNTTAGGGFTAAGVGGGITGKGTHCVIPYCAINTIYGKLPASKVRVGDIIYGYNHQTGRVEETRVVALSVSVRSAHVVECGDAILTADHPVFADGEYRPALASQGMPGMRLSEGAACAYLQSLLFSEVDERDHSARMHQLRQGVFSVSRGTREVYESSRQACTDILRQSMLCGIQDAASREIQRIAWELYRLWETASRQGAEEVLFASMLHGVQGFVSEYRELQHNVVGYQVADLRTGQSVSNVRRQESAHGGAPYRSRPGESGYRESDSAMYAVSQTISRTHGTCAEDIAGRIYSDDYVVDFQTETGNFFAGNLLVHNCLIVDDPIKNQEEADSVVVRDKLWDWYQSTAYTRLAPGGGVLIIETYWSFDDLAGRLQEAMNRDDENVDMFEIVKYPALSEQWEYRDEETFEIKRFEEERPDSGLTLLRPKDFCLHEARYSTEALKRIRANMQPRIWSALYQQNPTPDEGMYFKREFFRYAKQMPHPQGMRIFTAWDFAIGEKQQNDWTVGATGLQDEADNIYVLEIFRMKGDSFQIVEAMLDVAARWGSAVSSGYLIGVEDGQIWRAIKPMLMKRMEERKVFPPHEVMKPLSDKVARARPLQGRMQQGRIIFPENASWLGQAEQELLRFPAGAHDDVVDALAWLTHLCIGKAPPRIAVPPPLPSWRDKLAIVGGEGSHMSA